MSERQVVSRNWKQDGCGQLVDPNNASKAYSTDLVQLAREVQKADVCVRANVNNKMQMIVDQIRFLQSQAEKVLSEAHTNTRLHHVACNCKKIAGNMYYVYERSGGQQFMSMISPQEWGPQCPNKFVAAYRLEADMSWTPLEQLASRSEDYRLIDQLLGRKHLLTIPSVSQSDCSTASVDQSAPSLTNSDQSATASPDVSQSSAVTASTDQSHSLGSAS